MLTAAMDVVSDTESAIVSYARANSEHKGTLYLVIYGLLQAMYLQQDALRNMVHALEGSEVYKLDTEPEAMWIRQIRNDSVGHPTKQGTTKPRKDGASERADLPFNRAAFDAQGALHTPQVIQPGPILASLTSMFWNS